VTVNRFLVANAFGLLTWRTIAGNNRQDLSRFALFPGTLGPGRTRNCVEIFRRGDRSQGKAIFYRLASKSYSNKRQDDQETGKTLKEPIDNIVTYCTHGINNSVAENINRTIMSFKRQTGGYSVSSF